MMPNKVPVAAVTPMIMLVMTLATLATGSEIISSDESASRTFGSTGTLTLSGNDNNNFLQNIAFIVPLLLAIIVLDFAIFGTFARRSDNLNPISNFFFHAKRGLDIVRDRTRRRFYAVRPGLARPPPSRVARS